MDKEMTIYDLGGRGNLEKKVEFFFNRIVTFMRPLNIIVITLEEKQEPFVTFWVSSIIFKGLFDKTLHEE